MTGAAWWQRHQVRRLLRGLRDPRWQIVLAVTPDAAVGEGEWPRDLPRLPQGRGDLGRRMTRAIRASGPGPALLIGSDVPLLSARHVAAAFAAIGPARTILCPASDGGFWGVGYRNAKEARERDMAGVRWSGAHAMSDTRTRLPGPVATGSLLDDIDTASDLALLRDRGA